MVAVNYDWDELEDNIDEEYDDSGITIAEYTTEPYLYGDLISQHRNQQSHFYCFDGQGGTLSLTDSAGNTTDTYAYTAFGEVTEHTGSTENPYTYIGQKGYSTTPDFEDVIGRKSVYQPNIGRTISTISSIDTGFLPMITGGQSLYALFGNRPMSIAAVLTTINNSQPVATCLPIVRPPTKTPMPKCAVSLHGETSGEDKAFCNAIKGYGSTLCGACNGDEILGHVQKTKCCNLVVDGHRGDRGNTRNSGGLSNYLCSHRYQSVQLCEVVTKSYHTCPRKCGCWYRHEKCRIFPDPSLGTRLGWAMGANCSTCVIALRGCETGLFAGPLLELAAQTGCIVCGHKNSPKIVAPPVQDPLRSIEMKCVNPNGEQVGDPNMPQNHRFCGAEIGNPPGLNRPSICE